MILGNGSKCYEKGLVSLTCNCTAKKSCIQVVNFASIIEHHIFVSRIMLNMALLLRGVNEGEHVVVNQLVVDVDPSVKVGVDIGGATPDPNFSINEGKPRMHTTLPCVLQINFAFAFRYCIK